MLTGKIIYDGEDSMKYTTLGRTGIKVSVAGLGCGGHSRIGLSQGLGDDNAVKIIKTAFDLGINFFDTSPTYGTEKILGKGLEGLTRDNYVISTKFHPTNWGKELRAVGDFTKSLNASLKNMNLGYIDILHLHGVLPQDYKNSVERFMPEMIKAKEAGKIRWLGITEMFGTDTSHIMEQQALADNFWDVIMTGFNILNPSAIKTVFPLTIKNNVGTLIMFAVRTALSKNKRLQEIIAELVNHDEISSSKLSSVAPLGFLTETGAAKSIMDAAYRFCRHTLGIDIVLTGTSSTEHLIDNIHSILAPPLPADITNQIMDIFGNVSSVSG